MSNESIEVQNEVVTNPMFIDTDNFNFFDLEDVVADDTNELGYSTKQTGKDLMSKEDIEEAGEDVDELPDEGEDDGEPDESEEVEVTDEPEENPDGEEVDFETYEVTLPSGEVVVLSDAIKGYKSSEALKAERAEFESVRDEFTKQSEGLAKYLELARLEADRVIEDYEDFDWAAYKKDDPVGYVENREFLDRYRARRAEIVDAMEEIESKKKAAADEEFKQKAKEAGVVLARDIPGWNNELYQQLMMYAVENGATQEDIAASIDPVIFKVLYKAMQYEKGKQVVKAKVKKVGGSPTKVVKATSKPVHQSGSDSSVKRKAIIKKMESGGLTEKELSNSFAFLED